MPKNRYDLLRNIDIKAPHSGHMRILLGLVIKTTGPKAIKMFAGLYSYWQEVFNVSLLNKKITTKAEINRIETELLFVITEQLLDELDINHSFSADDILCRCTTGC